MIMRRLFQLSLCVIAVTLSGCAGYHVGPVNGERAGARSVQVNPFSNETLEPHLTDAVTTELRRYLQQDGTYRLATHDDGDILLSGVITAYTRQELILNPRDTLTIRDYRITITATVTARSRATGEVLFTQPVKGHTMARVGTDLTGAERQALPLLAADLAKNVKSLLAEGKWW
jgi:hypothetical protein